MHSMLSSWPQATRYKPFELLRLSKLKSFAVVAHIALHTLPLYLQDKMHAVSLLLACPDRHPFFHILQADCFVCYFTQDARPAQSGYTSQSEMSDAGTSSHRQVGAHQPAGAPQTEKRGASSVVHKVCQPSPLSSERISHNFEGMDVDMAAHADIHSKHVLLAI